MPAEEGVLEKLSPEECPFWEMTGKLEELVVENDPGQLETTLMMDMLDPLIVSDPILLWTKPRRLPPKYDCI